MPPNSAPDIASPHAPIAHTEVLSVGARVALDRQHIRSLKFREIKVREAFTIVDAAGTFFRASLKSLRPGGGEAVAYEQMVSSPESPARITLLCAVLSRQRMLVVVQKATELGCVRVVPVHSEHSVPLDKLDKEKPWAWKGQALRASRQCRRASVPMVLDPIPLEEALQSAYWSKAVTRFVLDDAALGEDCNPLETIPTEPTSHVLAVGPEGGWSDRERELLVESGATPLRLGSRILRA
ncbi:MAG: RsmE family RNA methyltransferase, partial [Myxococcales bacterium]|nr:RsmE family RNA methyltransferase [Myxococcales bacterium]